MLHSQFERILGIVCSVLEAYSAVLFLSEERGRNIKEDSSGCHLAAAFSLGDKIKRSSSVEPGKGLVGWILRHGEPLLVPNFDQRQNYLGYYHDNEEQRVKAFMGCALPGGRGVICVDSKRQYSFSEKDQKLLHLFAVLLADILENMGLTEEQRDCLEHYAALKAVYALRKSHSRWAEFLNRFLHLMAATTGFAYAVFCSLDHTGENYAIEGENISLLLKDKKQARSFPVQSGVMGWVFRNGTPLFTDSGEGLPEASLFGKGTKIPQFQSVMALPLFMQRKARGVLCLTNDMPLSLSEGTKNFALMASEHLALFLENLYIKSRLRDIRQSMVAGKSAAENDARADAALSSPGAE